MAQHSGRWIYHDDDCLCGGPCNRNAYVWSCCGACKEDSECSGKQLHPTHWSHPKFFKTTSGYNSHGRPNYLSNAEIRALAPDCFVD